MGSQPHQKWICPSTRSQITFIMYCSVFSSTELALFSYCSVEPQSSELSSKVQTVPTSPQPGRKLMLAATASQCNTTRSRLLPWEMVQIDFLLNYAHHHKRAFRAHTPFVQVYSKRLLYLLIPLTCYGCFPTSSLFILEWQLINYYSPQTLSDSIYMRSCPTQSWYLSNVLVYARACLCINSINRKIYIGDKRDPPGLREFPGMTLKY